MLKAFKEFLNEASGAGPSGEQELPARIIGLITFPFRFAFRFIGFLLTTWASTRPGFAFVRGLPALCAGGGLVVSVGLASFLLETRNVKRYEGLFNRQLQDVEDGEMAIPYAKKLLGFYPDNPEYHFRLGLARQKNADVMGAVDVMKHIGERGLPEKTSEGEVVLKKHPPAIVWLARQSISDLTWEPREEQRLKSARKYYEQAIELLDPEIAEDFPAFVNANMGLAEVNVRANKSDEAIKCYKNVLVREREDGSQDPHKLQLEMQLQAIPRLVFLLHKQGDDAEVNRWVSFAKKEIGKVAKRAPDQLVFWSTIVQSCEMAEDFDTANKTIDEAKLLASSSQSRARIEQLRGRIYLTQANSVEDISSKEPFQQCFSSACAAVASNPREAGGYQKLLEFVWPNEVIPEHDEWMNLTFVKKTDPAITHLTIGLRDLNAGRIAEGQKHWLIADNQKQTSQAILNNMLDVAALNEERFPSTVALSNWMFTSKQYGYAQVAIAKTSNDEVSSGEVGRFENLMDMVSVAIETFPSQPVFYMTRGKLRMKSDMLQEAKEDFEEAVEQLPNSQFLRTMMIEVYTDLGDSEKAELNQNELDRITGSSNEEQISQ